MVWKLGSESLLYNNMPVSDRTINQVGLGPLKDFSTVTIKKQASIVQTLQPARHTGFSITMRGEESQVPNTHLHAGMQAQVITTQAPNLVRLEK